MQLEAQLPQPPQLHKLRCALIFYFKTLRKLRCGLKSFSNKNCLKLLHMYDQNLSTTLQFARHMLKRI